MPDMRPEKSNEGGPQRMIASDGQDLYEVSCLDCGSSKSYFTAQGVNYFKMNHEGHHIKVREPDSKEPDSPSSGEESPHPVAQAAERRRDSEVENLVVDVVNDENRKQIKVFGVGGGRELFARDFGMAYIDELNSLLESGSFSVEGGGNYVWGPDRVDLSDDVARILDEASEQALGTYVESGPPVEPELRAPIPSPTLIPRVPQGESAPPIDSKDLLLAKSVYIKEGEDNQLEGVRVSRALAKFRWKLEPTYVIGAMFDNLLGVQSQSTTIEAGLLEAITDLGYSFIGFEAPNGHLTAWFRKNVKQRRRARGEKRPGSTNLK